MAGLIFIVYAVISVIAACLLFSVQPLVTKTLLPLFGGSPQVWNTCSFFFQLMLLFGYLYAHWLTTRQRFVKQFLVHLSLLALVLCFPLRLYLQHDQTSADIPIQRILFLLAASAGFPFFVLSSTAPLIQKWFSRMSSRGTGDPYFLYAASNFGSLLGLLLYPTVIEPSLTMKEQGQLWIWAYFLLAGLIAAAGLLSWKLGKESDPQYIQETQKNTAVSWPRALKWVMLAFIPSSLTLSVTTYLSTDIAAIPLFWIIPLSIYLVTFMIVFGKKWEIWYRVSARLFPILVLISLVIWKLQITDPLWIIIGAYLATLFICGIYFHGKLSSEKPEQSRLTFFYVCLSFGGILGAFFNAILTPVLFNSIYELPIVLVFSVFLWSGRTVEKVSFSRWSLSGVILFITALSGVTFYSVLAGKNLPPLAAELIKFVPPALVYAFVFHPVCYGWVLAGLLFIWAPNVDMMVKLHQNRNFFGVHTVYQDPGCQIRQYMHGTTMHGLQSMRPELKNIPGSYFHPDGPFGDIARNSPMNQEGARIAIVGLGVGTQSAYSRPSQHWDFYEIDPEVQKIAEGEWFTYLKDSKAPYRVILGDGRLKIAEAPARSYHMIVLDAFSSDSVPIHLLTREAMRIYLSKLTEEGVLVFNISNRYLELKKVLAGLATELGMFYASAIGETKPLSENCELRLPSNWIVMSPKKESLASLIETGHWNPLPPEGMIEGWSDDYSNLWKVFIFDRPMKKLEIGKT